MGEFFRGLGKLVQDLLDKIRKPEKQECESVSSVFGIIDTGTKEFNKNECVKIPHYVDVNFELVYDKDFDINELEKFVSISRTLLPKRIDVKTLILTMAANQQYDYQAVDLSQYEERGLAHYIVGSTKSPEELEAQVGGAHWDEEEDGPLWTEEGTCSAFVGKATLFYYEELGFWEVEYN